MREAQIFPSSNLVPENLLRFHIFFDEPGFSDQVLSAVSLIDDEGKEVQHAFLDLAQGLWDQTGTRLTLMLHPGRIKSGLVASRSMGAALERGRSYRLVLNLGMLVDGANNAIQSHSFQISLPEKSVIDIESWRLNTPPEKTNDALRISVNRALDRQSLEHAFAVQNAAAEDVAFSTSTADNEHTVLLTPLKPWVAGEYTLVVNSELEDTAGNRPNQRFETSADFDVNAEVSNMKPMPVSNLSMDSKAIAFAIC
jgi:Bacterial Ig-like domain